MSKDLINLTNKRISEMEKKLENERNKLDSLIKSTKSKGLEPLRFEIEKTSNGWNLIFPSGDETNNLPSLDVCLLIIKPHYQKCQFRNQAFILVDRNTNTKFRDYRVFTEWVEKADGEIVDQTPKIEKAQEKMEKKIKNSRIPRNGKVQSKVKKIDARIFDRTY